MRSVRVAERRVVWAARAAIWVWVCVAMEERVGGGRLEAVVVVVGGRVAFR